MVVNGGWSSWGPFGKCSKACGNGNRYSKRTCTNPSPAYGGADCKGSSSRSETCKVKECEGNYAIIISLNVVSLL